MYIFDLQLFATYLNRTIPAQGESWRDPNSTAYNANATGGANTLSVEMKTFYDMTLIDEASAALVHDQFGQKRPIPKGSGKTIEFRKFSALPKATTPLTEGVTPDGKRLDVTAITATVAQYGDYITQSDILELTALDNTILEATKLLGRQAGLTLDTITRNVLSTSTNYSYCSRVVDGEETPVEGKASLDTSCQLTVKEVQKVVAKLRGQNAPTINGKYVAIAHPYVIYSLMRDPEWMAVKTYSDASDLYAGEVGEIGGVRFVQTTEALVERNSAHAVFHTFFIGEGAYGVTEITGGGLQTIVKQKGSAGTADPLDQRSSVGWKAIKTAELLIPQYLVNCLSCVKDFDSTAAN